MPGCTDRIGPDIRPARPGKAGAQREDEAVQRLMLTPSAATIGAWVAPARISMPIAGAVDQPVEATATASPTTMIANR